MDGDLLEEVTDERRGNKELLYLYKVIDKI